MKSGHFTLIAVLLLAVAAPKVAIGQFIPRPQIEGNLEVVLWAEGQACTYPITDPENSVDGAVNGLDNAVAACAGDFSRDEGWWEFFGFQELQISQMDTAFVEISFFIEGWQNERYRLQIYDARVDHWRTLITFDRSNPLSLGLAVQSIPVSDELPLAEALDNPRVRLLADPSGSGQGDHPATIFVDAVRIRVIGSPIPTMTPVHPGATHTVTPRPYPTRTNVPAVSPTLTQDPPQPVTPPSTPIQAFTPTPTRTPIQFFTVTPTSTAGIGSTQTATSTGDPVATQTATIAPVPMTPGPITNDPVPTPTLPPSDPTDIPDPGNPHGNFGNLSGSCASCHRSHAAAGPDLRSVWPEEGVCFQCHGAAGPALPVEVDFLGRENTYTGFFRHDVFRQEGVHTSWEAAGQAYSGAGRHVECEDCHDPHQAAGGPAAAPAVPWEMNGASGVDPLWTAEGAPATYNWLPEALRAYQVCFKCHTSYAELPSYLPDGWDGEGFVADGLKKITYLHPDQINDSRDLAEEFNPFNASFHPVVAPGRNLEIPVESIVGGWSVDSLMYCSDCHQNPRLDAETPHSSSNLHLLDGDAEYQTIVREGAVVSPDMVCFKCHSAAVYLAPDNPNTNFFQETGPGRNLHGVHMVWGATCYACHDSHGSEQAHLLNFNLADEIRPMAGLNSQTAWFPVGEQSGCALVCHGKMHNGQVSRGYRYP